MATFVNGMSTPTQRVPLSSLLHTYQPIISGGRLALWLFKNETLGRRGFAGQGGMQAGPKSLSTICPGG